MPKHQGINRNYSATDEYGGKTPEERAKELKKRPVCVSAFYNL